MATLPLPAELPTTGSQARRGSTPAARVSGLQPLPRTRDSECLYSFRGAPKRGLRRPIFARYSSITELGHGLWRAEPLDGAAGPPQALGRSGSFQTENICDD